MQIQDFIGQLGTYVSSGNKNNSIKRSETVSSKSSEGLIKGQIFEGNVSSIKGDKVTLSLPNGQTMTARLQADIPLKEGESVFFQVKSNDGKTIEITPLQNGISNNPILLNALKESALPISERNLELVNNLMQNSLPINADNLSRMGRLINSNPDVPVETLVKMDRFSIEATPENIDNFIRFEENSSAILEEVDSFVSNLPDMVKSMNLSKSDTISLQQAIIDACGYKLEGENELENIEIPKNELFSNNPEEIKDAKFSNDTKEVFVDSTKVIDENNTSSGKNIEKNIEITKEVVIQSPTEEVITNENTSQSSVVKEGLPVEKAFIKPLTEELTSLPGFKENNPELFDENGNIRSDIPEKEILTKINEFLKNNPDIPKDKILNLFSGKGYQKAFQTMVENEWLMKPEEVSEKDAVKKLYEKLETQLSNMDKVAKAFGGNENPISNSIKGIQSNVDFMNQMNQLYSYIQIPLKMTNQSATGDLYVYSNRNKGKSKGNDISAFLHLTLSHLGNTDISVTLHEKQVGIRFYLEDESSYKLINDNIDKLDERLREKGYISNITVSNEEAKENFVEKMLDIESVDGDKKIKRYSFDVRA